MKLKLFAVIALIALVGLSSASQTITVNNQVDYTYTADSAYVIGSISVNKPWGGGFDPRENVSITFTTRENLNYIVKVNSSDAGIYPHYWYFNITVDYPGEKETQVLNYTVNSAYGTYRIKLQNIYSDLGLGWLNVDVLLGTNADADISAKFVSDTEGGQYRRETDLYAFAIQSSTIHSDDYASYSYEILTIDEFSNLLLESQQTILDLIGDAVGDTAASVIDAALSNAVPLVKVVPIVGAPLADLVSIIGVAAIEVMFWISFAIAHAVDFAVLVETVILLMSIIAGATARRGRELITFAECFFNYNMMAVTGAASAIAWAFDKTLSFAKLIYDFATGLIP